MVADTYLKKRRSGRNTKKQIGRQLCWRKAHWQWQLFESAPHPPRAQSTGEQSQWQICFLDMHETSKEFSKAHQV